MPVYLIKPVSSFKDYIIIAWLNKDADCIPCLSIISAVCSKKCYFHRFIPSPKKSSSFANPVKLSCYRQHNLKLAPLPCFALNLYLSIMRINDCLYDWESKTCAWNLAAGFINTIKPVKDFVKMLFRNSNACIRYGYNKSGGRGTLSLSKNSFSLPDLNKSLYQKLW